jgi:hypothetical protein
MASWLALEGADAQSDNGSKVQQNSSAIRSRRCEGQGWETEKSMRRTTAKTLRAGRKPPVESSEDPIARTSTGVTSQVGLYDCILPCDD